jgi:hypothetical protein
MEALEQALPVPSSRRRILCGVTALVAFGVFLVLNFWPGWSSIPFLTDGMRLTVGLVDLALWGIIAFNVAFLFSDARGLHLTAHLIIAMLAMLAFTELIRDFPFTLSGVWVGVVHWILILGVVLSFLTIPATWWQMVFQGYEEPGGQRPRRHFGRHRHAS